MNIKEQVISVIEERFPDRNVKAVLEQTDDFSKLEINSIEYVKLVVDLETAFDIEFEDEKLKAGSFRTIEDLCSYIKQASGK